MGEPEPRDEPKRVPLLFYPRSTQPERPYALIPIDVSAFKDQPPPSMNMEESEDLQTWTTRKPRPRCRKRRGGSSRCRPPAE